MCGLAGLVADSPRSADRLRSSVREMAGTMTHRGPDDEGEYVDRDAGLGLGFRRLAIQDLSSAGRQPMRSASGRYVIVYNGEAYNYPSLRRELSRRGASFSSECDTEVVLAAVEEWGIRETLPRLVGMFAMAVWDARERTVTLARDRLGIKPLFVYSGEDVVGFASELKALCRLQEFPRRLDHDALASYLRHLYVPTPDSIFEDTRKLPPGRTLTFSAPAPDELPSAEPYWSLEDVARRGVEDRFEGSPREAAERLGELLETSVAQRMVADVPVGALFSGGIDSTSVVAAMQDVAGRDVQTFTVSFDRDEHDESEAAREMAGYLGTDHTELEVGGDDALELIPRLPEMFDEPLANPAQVPTYLVCELAERHVTVGLAGDGGDEVFGGYNRYRYGEQMLPATSSVPGPLRRGLAAAVGAVSTETWRQVHRSVRPVLPDAASTRLPGEKMRKLGDLMAADDVSSMYRSLVSACQHPDELLIGGRERDAAGNALPAEAPFPDLLERMLLADQRNYLPDDLLAKVDRASMATSLEVRVPLLDRRIVEFAWRLPPEMKIRDGTTKWLLRRQLENRVPKYLWDRPKVGFTVPLVSWLRGPLSEWAGDLLSRRQLLRDGVFRAGRVHDMWQRFRDGETHLANGLWAILMFQAWMREWDVSVG